MSLSLSITIMAALVIMSAYFSATETAFSSLNRTRLKAMSEKNKRAALALRLEEKYDRLISTILIGNNIVNIAVASLGTVIFVNRYGDIGATISTVVITIVVLIFGEISPKSVAKDSPEKFATFSAPIINAFIILLTPINFIFTQWKKFITKLLKIEEDAKMSQEELLLLVDEIEQEGSVDSEEGELIRNVIEFTEQDAEDILTHRVDVEAVDIDATAEEVAEVFYNTRFSRLLVYEENIDNVVGIIHLKDFMTPNGDKKDIKSIMTEPLFVQKSVKINDLLKTLQQNKAHIAVVVDEYGGTLGIVTMEDILEELVGEIWDEHDEIVEDFKKLDENTYQVDGSVSFDDFADFFELENDETDSVSVGGWVTEQLDKLPEDGDKFVFENLDITILETESHRVNKLIVVKTEEKENDEEK